MTRLAVWTYRTPAGARRAVRALLAVPDAGPGVHDGALVDWPRSDRSPHAAQLEELAGPEALGASFWDMVFGFVFVLPDLAAAKGESPAPVWGALADGGIDELFLQALRARTGPGTSALCLLHADEVAVLLDEACEDSGEPIVAVLDEQQLGALQRVFPRR